MPRVELPFPLKGTSGDSAFGRTPEGMSPDALNVVGYDAVGGRLRGGQRPGLSRFWTTQLTGAAVRVQALALGTSSVQPNDGTGFTEPFSHPDEEFWSAYPTLWNHYEIRTALLGTGALFQNVVAADVDCIAEIVSNELKYAAGAASRANAHIYQGATVTAGTEYTVGFDLRWDAQESGNFYVFLRVNPTYNGECYALQFSTNVALDEVNAKLGKGTSTSIDFEATEATLGGLDVTADMAIVITVTAAGAVSITVDGAAMSALPDNTPMDSYATYTRVGLGGFINTGTADVFYADDFAMTGTFIPSEGGHDVRVVAVADGDVYIAEEGDEPLLASSGNDALAAANVCRFVGTALHHGSTSDTGPEKYHQIVYFADGVNWKRLDLASRSILTWAAAAGSLPVDSNSNKPKIIATYRDRIVLSGLVDDPQNWFMSAVGEADDFDYGATVSATMAVAGNNSDAGKVGDVVTALAPYSDDVMVMGGDHTLWIMRGDPADSGIIDNISYKTGISGPRAFTWDTFGRLHFFGAGTHWAMSATDAEPTPISRGRMDRLWGALDLSSFDIQLAWDVVQQGLHIFVVPRTSGATTHWFWDQRTDAYWPIQYPNAMNPASVLNYDARASNDTALLMGGFDGYVRKIDATQKSDDTGDNAVAINSYVLFTPINPGASYQNTKLIETVAVLSSGTDAATVSAYSGETPETAIALGKLHFARAVLGGRTVLHNQAAGNTLVMRVGNSTEAETWALEALEVSLSGGGRTRKKGSS